MVEVPGVGGQGAFDRVHDGVLHDVDGARHPSWEERLCPARQSVGLHEEPPRQEEVVRCHFPVHHIFRKDVSADTQIKKKRRGKKTRNRQIRFAHNFHIIVVAIVSFGLIKCPSIHFKQDNYL